jgi:hypothetical protein
VADKGDWKGLLKIAVTYLRDAHVPDVVWTFGGGTLLRFYYNHRVSNDIDIFLSDPQYLAFLTPRLNDEMADVLLDYAEMSNFLTLQLKQGKVDYVVAANVTGLKPSVIEIDGMNLNAEQPEEVIIKKMLYRADTFKMRDVIDAAVVLRDKRASLAPLVRRVCFSRIDIILDRMNSLRSIDLEEIELLDKTLSKKASMSLLHDFLWDIKQGSKQIEERTT